MTTPIKWGNDFLVPTTTSGLQAMPQAIGLPNGQFVVLWTDYSQSATDTSGTAVRAQRFYADAVKFTAEEVVNTRTTGDQLSPAAAPLSNGGYVRVWQSWNTLGDSDGFGIAADILGTNVGEFAVNTAVLGQQLTPVVAGFENGRFVAAWHDTQTNQIKAQIFTNGGAKSGAEIAVSSPAQLGVQPVISVLSDGNFVVAWQSNDTATGDQNGTAIRARLYSTNGAPLGADFTVNATTASNQTAPNVTALAGGDFVVTWTDFSKSGADTSATAVRGQVFNNNGSPVGSEFLVNTTTANDQSDSTVAGLPDGNFVVTWTNQSNPSDFDVRGQLFTHDGSKLGDEFLIGPRNGLTQSGGSIGVLADGRFVVTYNEAGDVRAQIFDPRQTGIVKYGTADNDHYVGTAFTDQLHGGGGGDRLFGGDGDDMLNGGAGEDELHGGAGSDTASYLSSPAGVFISLEEGTADGGDASGDILTGIENLYGSANDDGLTGNAADNALFGEGGKDYLGGKEGNDQLHGGAGADVLDGGAGVDTATYEGSSAGVKIFLAAGLGKGGDAEGDKLIGIENVTGGNADDQLYGDAGDNRLRGHGGNDVLKGGGGSDVLFAGPGNDTVDGGIGDDTAVFGDRIETFTFETIGPHDFRVTHADGVDYLTGIEHLDFDSRIIDVDDGNALFDTVYYLSHNTDVFYAGVDALEHYNTVGWREGRDPSAFFDTSGYLANNRDVAVAGVNPLDHYHQNGWREGRDPSANFDTTLYLQRNPDVAAAGIDPLEHYMAYGMAEERLTYKAVGAINNGFDAQHYLFMNPDVAAAGVNPVQHYNDHGWHEGRNPNGWFDTAGYLSHYADVAAAGVNPFEHYMQYGAKEGRDPSSFFDTRGYLANNADVAAAGVNPLEHFLRHGIYEGREAVNDGLWA